MKETAYTPDLAMARCHLLLLDEDAEKFVFQVFDDSEQKNQNLARVLYGTLDDCAPALECAQRVGCGVFVTVNRSRNGGRTKTDIDAYRAIWREADEPNLPVLPVEPHFVIETSPGHKHEYILLEPSDDMDTGDAIMERMVQDYGSCPGAKDRARVLRLAGFYHLKDPANPYLVKIIREKGGLPHPLDYVRKLIPPLIKADRHTAPLIADTIPEHSRNTTLISLAGSMRRRGMGEAEILAALTVTNRERCVLSLKQTEVKTIVRSVMRYPPAETPAKTAPDCHFKLVRAGEIEAKAPQWVVRELLEKDALALVFGDPGCGKSFWALDLALCVATGTSHHGHEVQQGPVIYIAGEGQNGIKRRLIAWSKARGVDHCNAPLYLSLMPTALTNEDAMASVIAAIDATAATAPVLVVIDTVARNFGPADENSTSDMSRFIAAADVIRERYQLTVLLVHHSGHGDKTRARGAMALKGALDAEYRMDKDETGTIRLEATKMKEAEHPEPMAFRLRSVDLDLADPDTGEVITSAALETTSYEPRAVRGKQGRGKHQTRALEILQDLWDARQGSDENRARVSLDEWKSAMKGGAVPTKQIGHIMQTLLAARAVRESHGFVVPVM